MHAHAYVFSLVRSLSISLSQDVRSLMDTLFFPTHARMHARTHACAAGQEVEVPREQVQPTRGSTAEANDADSASPTIVGSVTRIAPTLMHHGGGGGVSNDDAADEDSGTGARSSAAAAAGLAAALAPTSGK